MPLARPVDQLAAEPRSCVDKEIQTYFRDVADHLTRVTEQITAWAAIIAVPTMVCGVYGMNFEHMPGLRRRFGYPLVLTVIATACLVIHRGFKRNGWL